MNNQFLVRIALGYQILVAAQIGFWALLAPQSFYDGFPGTGRAWVAADGPFNEHLIRDFGALNLALLVVLGWAAVKLTRELVQLAAAASLVWGIPHLLYHAFNTDVLSTSDAIASLAGLAVAAAFSVMLVVVARNPAFASQP